MVLVSVFIYLICIICILLFLCLMAFSCARRWCRFRQCHVYIICKTWYVKPDSTWKWHRAFLAPFTFENKNNNNNKILVCIATLSVCHMWAVCWRLQFIITLANNETTTSFYNYNTRGSTFQTKSHYY